MSDFRFKIQGDANPFLIQLSAGTTPICETTFGYSGSSSASYDASHKCMILSSLEPSTSYSMNIVDSVGKNYLSNFTTEGEPTPPPPKSINVDLLGTYNATNSLESVIQPKYVEVTPPLISGECVDLTFNLIASGGTTDTATVELYKKCGVGGTYLMCESLVKTNSYDDVSVSVSMGVGDELCYNLSSSITHESGVQCLSYAMSCLDLTNASLSGSFSGSDSITCSPQTNLRTYRECCTTTTTMPPPSPSVEVYWGQVVSDNEQFADKKSAPLCTNPELVEGQSFRLNIYNKAFYEFDLDINRDLCGRAYTKYGGVEVNDAYVETEYLDGGYCADFDDSSHNVYVDCDSITGIFACVIACSDMGNATCEYNVYGCSELISIYDAVEGIYSMSATETTKITALFNETGLGGGGHGPEEPL